MIVKIMHLSEYVYEPCISHYPIEIFVGKPHKKPYLHIIHMCPNLLRKQYMAFPYHKDVVNATWFWWKETERVPAKYWQMTKTGPDVIHNLFYIYITGINGKAAVICLLDVMKIILISHRFIFRVQFIMLPCWFSLCCDLIFVMNGLLWLIYPCVSHWYWGSRLIAPVLLK